MLHRMNRLHVPTKRWFASTVTTQAPLVVKNHRILASVILARAPQITRDATPFEKAYFDYKEKQERQQAAAFPTDFYFKKGSVAERRWKEDEAARQAAMTNPAQSLTEATQITQAQWANDDAAMVKVNLDSRVTAADKENKVQSLDRALQRTLYLVVHKPNDSAHPWQFPQGELDSTEYLHEAAERQLKEACGPDMDTWFVGRQPISHFKQSPSQSKDGLGTKIFFMKARIYAGQVKPSNSVKDFAWLTKEELGDYLSPDYYEAVKGSLGDL